MFKRLFIVGFILFFAGSCYAATAGNTSDPKIPYGPGISNLEATGFGPLKVSFDADIIFDRDLDSGGGIANAEIDESQWYLFRIGYTFFDRIEPYIRLGMAHTKASWDQNGTNVRIKGDNAFAIGFGGKVLAFEMPEQRLRFSVDGQYRYTDPDIDRVIWPGANVSATEFKIREWQVAGIVSMEFPLGYDEKDPAAIYSLIPYMGLAYFDSDVDAGFTHMGTSYSIGSAENNTKFLVITGCDLTSPNNLTLNIEGRYVGETALSGGFTAKF